MQSTGGRSASGIVFRGSVGDELLEGGLFAFFFFFLFGFWSVGNSAEVLSRVGDSSVEETVGDDVEKSS